MYSIWIYIYGKQEIKKQINVSAQADHPLFVWSLLLLKSENQFFFFLLYRRITGEPEAAERFETWREGEGGSHLPLSHTHTPTQIF